MNSDSFTPTTDIGLSEVSRILGIKVLVDQNHKLYFSNSHPMGENIKPLMTDGNNVWYFENETFAEIADKNIAPEHLLFYDEDDKSVVLKVKVTTNDFIKISSFNEEQNLIREESFDIKNWKNTKIEHNPMNKMNDNLKPTNNKPLIEIGKILETDFYEDEKKNLYYRDFPDSSKLNEDSIYPLHSQERDFWVIKDGYTVNLSVVNWMDYNKMREGPHNEAELPNLYITLSTPNKVFELVFNIDGKLIPNQEKIENDDVNISLETKINKDKKDDKLLQDEIKSLNISINNEYFNVKLLPDCELQNLIEEDILNIYELVSSYFKKNTGFWKKSVTGHEIVMLWAQSRDPRILNIKIQNKEKFITLGLGSLLSQLGFSCDATLMLTQNFKRK